MQNEKLIIGLVGEKGGGKETIGNFIIEKFSSKKVSRVRSSDVLSDTLNQWGIPLNRRNLQHLAIIMNKEYGVDSLSNAVKKLIDSIDAEIIIFDGIRWESDIKLLRSFAKNKLIYITTTPEIRYERTKKRKQKVGEHLITFEQFLEEEKVDTEIHIPVFGKDADIKIDNSGTEIDLKEAVSKIKI